MKKIVGIACLTAFFVFMVWVFSYASGPVWSSSNTATADTTQALCTKTFLSSWPHGIVHGLCVNTGAAGTYTIFNSSAAAIQPLAAIDTTAKGCQYYDVQMSSGVTYTNSATANVTLLYSCY